VGKGLPPRCFVGTESLSMTKKNWKQGIYTSLFIYLALLLVTCSELFWYECFDNWLLINSKFCEVYLSDFYLLGELWRSRMRPPGHESSWMTWGSLLVVHLTNGCLSNYLPALNLFLSAASKILKKPSSVSALLFIVFLFPTIFHIIIFLGIMSIGLLLLNQLKVIEDEWRITIYSNSKLHSGFLLILLVEIISWFHELLITLRAKSIVVRFVNSLLI
jgi:hypothetical protein